MTTKASKKTEKAFVLPKKPDTAWFMHDRLGMFIHWGLYSMPGRHEWVRNHERMTGEQYAKYFRLFDPDLYDPTIWAKAAKKAGMKYFVITTKHHEGFCLWNTKYTDYKAPNTPAGRDLLTPMVNAFRKEGIKVGFYYSLIDWNHPEFTIDGTHPQRGDEEFKKSQAKRDQSKYAAYMRNQVTELLTQFGKIDILWFDFSYPGPEGKGHKEWESEKLLTLVRKLQPHVLIDNRLDIPNSGDFDTPEQHQPAEAPKDGQGNVIPWEGCQTFSGSWGYHRDELTWKSLNMLLWMLIDGVSKGGNLLLNVGPTSRGEIDYRAMDRLDGMGKWMHHHNRAIYGCGQAPAGLVTPTGCRYTYNAKTNRLYLHMFEWAFNELFVDGLKDIIDYSQFLHDGSEVIWRARDEYGPDKKRIAFILPHVKPNAEVPVIEILLKK